ncbi:MAG: Xanthine dehydrogenase, FAD binding subunit [Candidatus Ozemobacter sibiricus]|jgi:CO/xanthine dehydrogenase FAD-binding subunit|uniref:Xanthine dehydrogenase, FAD binding subunit n=1 Tax=Candidatus Ozemobacter sibiricus TaxID=2268124 RepID=A0A367ZSI7_9BACT|nr:MAG: Xanthine dehydrogenase, FAD binding subunit [Candidatus Ozemobacter sibiricus]
MDSLARVHFPATLSEAAAILRARPGARLIAGGTDLLVKHRNGLLPEVTDFIDVTGLGLHEIVLADGQVRIGSGCTMTAVAGHPLVRERFPALVQGAMQVGAFQIRNAATLGGNVGNASPAGDSIPPLVSLDAVALLFGPDGRRTVPLAEFFTGPGKTVLQPGELIEAFLLPDRRTAGAFLKLGERRAHAISKVSLAFSCWESAPGRREVRIALGAVAPTVIRCRKAEELLSAAPWPPPAELVDKARALVVEAARPIDDLRSQKEYRRRMTGVLFQRALEQVRA